VQYRVAVPLDQGRAGPTAGLLGMPSEHDPLGDSQLCGIGQTDVGSGPVLGAGRDNGWFEQEVQPSTIGHLGG